MEVDVNARIKWTPGMELTAELFKALGQGLSVRRGMLLQSVFGLNFGLLEGKEFQCEGRFVSGKLEVRIPQCFAKLANGHLIEIHQEAAISIPRLPDGYCYLTADLGEKMIDYEVEGIPMTRPEIVFDVELMDRLKETGHFPLMRMSISDGAIAIDSDFITPCLVISSDHRISEFMDMVISNLEKICDHPNLVEIGAKIPLRRYLFYLRSCDRESGVNEMVNSVMTVCDAANYFILTKFGKPAREFTKLYRWDIELWMRELKVFFEDILETLDEAVIEEETIDYEKIKAEIREDIYSTLKNEILSEVNIHVENVIREYQDRISEALKDFINGDFRRQIHETLHTELTDELKQSLYTYLYDALYAALFVPQVEEVQEDIPMI